MNYPSCVLSYLSLGDYVMGYISHPNVIILWMLGFLTYHAKRGEVLSNPLWIMHLWTSSYVSDAHNHFFACWLLSIRLAITILYILLLCILFFPLIQYVSPPVFYMDILNISISKFVISVEFAVCMGVVHYKELLGWIWWGKQGIFWIQ